MGLFEAGRGVGITELLQGQSEFVVVLFALITQLGDVWFLFSLGGLLYVMGDELPRWGIARRRGLFVLALTLTYIALIGALKQLFVLPRPPGATVPLTVDGLPTTLDAVLADITTAEGPGFPSGHALGTTMVWGGLAIALERGSAKLRFSIAGIVVVLVSLSRLVLGVHYAVDVVVGATLGVIVLGGLYWLSDRGTDPGRILLVAVAVGILGLATGTTFDSVAAVGGAVGAWLVWRTFADATPPHPTTRRETVAGFAILAAAGVLFGVIYAVEPAEELTFLGAAIAAGGAIGAPLLGERLA